LVAGLVFVLCTLAVVVSGVTVLWCRPAVRCRRRFVAALGYTALAGFCIPTQRALVMLAVALGGVVPAPRTRHSVLLAAGAFAVADWLSAAP